MNRLIDRLKLFFLGLFAIACVVVWAYQLLWVAPMKACESHGNWWDPFSRVCATPLYLPNLTGRPAGALSPTELKARAEEAKAREAAVLSGAASASPAKP
ncbi:MAG TPA: hypothetical protein VG960_14445 [Caulobacteraceae bacterium]|nr:hypothetical protein [Caulobacteraceae bacterium]